MREMGTLYLVRHGQASFGAANYDNLSELGTRQCTALGAWMRECGLAFEGVMRGTLVRQRQSLEAIASQLPGLPEAREWPSLNEYDSGALIETVLHTLDEPLPPENTPEGYRAHFRLLRQALQAWMEGRTQPRGMPTWRGWLEGVEAALDHVRTSYGGNVLMVSSGGPISTAVTRVLGAPGEAMVELNLRMRNSSVTEFAFTPRRHALVSYNGLPHLEHPERRGWVTFA